MATGEALIIIDTLHHSEEPAIRYKTLVNVLGQDPDSTEAQQAREQVRTSMHTQRLLSERTLSGEIPWNVYAKWKGAHWVLATLADIGYPPGDDGLIPLREQVLGWLLGEAHTRSVPVIAGKARRCASQEGNALYALLTLGLADERCDEIARRLRGWQWPDGGWNCDKRPQSQSSSFMESLIPLRALALHARLTGNADSRAAADRAAEVFLERRMFRRRRDGSVISDDFLRLHYPCYWHYDILFGLKVLAEAGRLDDKRCRDALDILQSKRLPAGGFPAEAKYYNVSEKAKTGRSLVDWGVTSTRHLNPFVTVDALYVLRSANY